MAKPPKQRKQRVDACTVAQGLAADLDEARRLIMAGEIRTGDHVWNAAAALIPIDTVLERKRRGCRYVSRGGLKLAKALREFAISPQNRRCLDIGSSTGGFTDVLLQEGAAHVTAVDVGRGLLDVRLMRDLRVHLLEGVNFRLAEPELFGAPYDLIVADVSFMSLTEILPNASRVLGPDGMIIALIKPQFEAPPHLVPKGGIISDPALHEEVILGLRDRLHTQGLILCQLGCTDLDRTRKNVEYPSLWQHNGPLLSQRAVQDVIGRAPVG